MKVLIRENPRTLAIQSASHSLIFRQISTSGEQEQPKVEVNLRSNREVSGENGFKNLIYREVFGCLGLISVQDQIYIAVVTGASLNVARPLPYESVNKIYKVDFFSLSSNEWDYVTVDANGMTISATSDNEDFESPMARVVHPCFEYRKLLSNGSFYYSNDFDLTSLLQARGVNQERIHNYSEGSMLSPVNVQHYQELFMWNSFMMEELIQFRSSLNNVAAEIVEENKFLTTVIRGFAKTSQLGASRLDTISIVSKQSWKRAGTRFNARGIDDDGNVANFVETEFIYYHASAQQVFSFTQIRGSVPSFWEQDSTLINPKITITRSREASQLSFNKHFTEICDKYGVCHIVNLLSKSKTSEVEISRRYVKLLQNSDHREELNYSHFDFHAETKPSSGGFAGATKIIHMIRDSIEKFGWYDFDTQAGEVVMRQSGVFRVNCLDCLDRTNLIEQVISQTVADHIVHNIQAAFTTRDRIKLEEFTAKHNELWADNGDAISQIYTGTNALKSSFTRSGKMNLAGALSDVTKSVSRMYQNTFVDSKKQLTMDTLLGKDGRLSRPVKILDPIGEYVAEKLLQSEATFTSYDTINMFTGTYNVNAAPPSAYSELTNWLFPPENTAIGFPELYAIGMQEIIELNAGSILAADTTKPSQWARVLHQLLNSREEEYLLLRTESIASMSLFFFAKKSIIHHVTQVSGSSKKTGMGGIAANKGACAVRFEYGATSFALVTSHLAAGVNATTERHNEFATILSGLTFTRNYRISDHENVIWFGDLNYRLDLTNERCRQLLNSGAFDEMQQVDQLTLEKKEVGGAFHQFNESRVLFYPTYKFDRGTSDYDTSEKQRVPSWTDRILFKCKNPKFLTPLNYNAAMDIFISDHKPVYSTFLCTVKSVDEKKKKDLSIRFYSTYKNERGEPPDFESGSDSLASSSCSGSTFRSEALSNLNLLDFDPVPPALPVRSKSVLNALPKRIPPPPPISRRVLLPENLPDAQTHSRVASWGNDSRGSSNYFTDLRTSAIADHSQKPVAPSLPPRSLSSKFATLQFNTAPLSPHNSGISRHLSVSGTNRDTSSANLTLLKPLKPHKPENLCSVKLVPKGTEVVESKPGQVIDVKEKNGFDSPPPTSRTTIGTMADWKPLIPQ